MGFDYEDVEDTRVHEHLEQMRELQNWQGWGLGKLCFAIEEYPQSLGGVMGSAALTARKFFSALHRLCTISLSLSSTACLAIGASP